MEISAGQLRSIGQAALEFSVDFLIVFENFVYKFLGNP
jgi:hypothetical protein